MLDGTIVVASAKIDSERTASSNDDLVADLTALVERYTRVVGDPNDESRSVKFEERPIPVHLIRELLVFDDIVEN